MGGFVLFTLLAATLIGTAPCEAASVLDRVEASVNSSTILLSDIERFRKNLRLRQQLDPLFQDHSLAKKSPSSITAQEAVDFLVDEVIVLQQFPVSDSDVDREINTIQANNKITRSTLSRALEEQGFRFEDYFELIRASAAKRNLVDREIRIRASISDDDIRNYYVNHMSDGAKASSPLYQVKIITVTPSNYKSPQVAYDVAQRAIQSLRSNASSFEDTARSISDDASKDSGGDLGYLRLDQISPTLRNELKKMRVGETSGVLGTPESSYFILKLVDIKTGDDDRYEKLKPQIQEKLLAEEYQNQIRLWLERQRQSAYIHRAGEESKVPQFD